MLPNEPEDFSERRICNQKLRQPGIGEGVGTRVQPAAGLDVQPERVHVVLHRAVPEGVWAGGVVGQHAAQLAHVAA